MHPDTRAARASTAHYGANATAALSPAYVDIAAFPTPAAYTIGNLARTAPYGLRGPSTYDVDMSLKRTITVHEKYKIRVLPALGLRTISFSPFLLAQDARNVTEPNGGTCEPNYAPDYSQSPRVNGSWGGQEH